MRFVLTIILLIVLSVGYVNLKKYQLKQDVQTYLLSQGYKSSDIQSITTHFAKAPVFSARVVFSDESNIIYYYLDEDGIRQFGAPTNMNGKNSNQSFKHLDPYNK